MTYDNEFLKRIAQRFNENKENIAVAESVTAGLLQNAFSQMPDASTFFEGGMTAYTPEIKIKLLKIDPEEAERENCVSEAIAEAMAENLKIIFSTNWSIAITGYATPVPESNHQLFAYYCILYNENTLSSKRIELPDSLNPIEAQQQYVYEILKDLENQLNLQFKK